MAGKPVGDEPHEVRERCRDCGRVKRAPHHQVALGLEKLQGPPQLRRIAQHPRRGAVPGLWGRRPDEALREVDAWRACSSYWQTERADGGMGEVCIEPGGRWWRVL